VLREMADGQSSQPLEGLLPVEEMQQTQETQETQETQQTQQTQASLRLFVRGIHAPRSPAPGLPAAA